MDIFATQPYRISPLAKREFSERQQFGHAVESGAHIIEPSDKKTGPKEAKNQLNIQHQPQQLKSHEHEVRAYQAAYVAIGDPQKQLQNAGITQPSTSTNPVATSNTITDQSLQIAAISRIKVGSNDHAASGFSKASAAAQYQQLERETNPGVGRLSEYA